MRGRRLILAICAMLVISAVSAVIGYMLGLRKYESAIRANTCMARYAEADGTLTWMYVGDKICPRESRRQIQRFD